MRMVPVPCLIDNYAYLVICEQTRTAAVVDPSDAEPVRAAADREGVTITALWCTHHHWDHVGGNQVLAEALRCDVVGHVSDRGRMPAQTREVADGDVIGLGAEVRARILHVPGHTTGAVSYFIEAVGDQAPAVFTGDTLFGAGCGRLFEGTAAMMYASLSRLARLPPETRVYCGHEYTAQNLRFAAAVEPDNAAIAARAAGLRVPSVPSTMAEELATNPFLRAKDEADFAERRRRKDSF